MLVWICWSFSFVYLNDDYVYIFVLFYSGLGSYILSCSMRTKSKKGRNDISRIFIVHENICATRVARLSTGGLGTISKNNYSLTAHRLLLNYVPETHLNVQFSACTFGYEPTCSEQRCSTFDRESCYSWILFTIKSLNLARTCQNKPKLWRTLNNF